MAQLITLDDIKIIKPISSNLNVDKKLNTFILEAQEFDLKPILGDEMYLDLIDGLAASPQTAEILNIWNEKIYVFANRKYISAGLKKVLAYYAWARYEENAATEQTAFGAVEKMNNPYSRSSENKIVAQKVAQARSGAVALQNSVVKYIMYHSTAYPHWHGGNYYTPKQTSGAKIRAVGGNSSFVPKKRNEMFIGTTTNTALVLIPIASGVIDGVNDTFTFVDKPTLIFLQGNLLTRNAISNGYSLSGNDSIGWTIVLTNIPFLGDNLIAYK